MFSYELAEALIRKYQNGAVPRIVLVISLLPAGIQVKSQKEEVEYSEMAQKAPAKVAPASSRRCHHTHSQPEAAGIVLHEAEPRAMFFLSVQKSVFSAKWGFE